MNQTVQQYRGSGPQTGGAHQVPRFESLMMAPHQEHVHYQILPPVPAPRNKIMVDVSTMTDPEEEDQAAAWQNVNVPSNTKVAEYLSSLRQFFKDADGTKFRVDVTGGNQSGVVPATTLKTTRRKDPRTDPDTEHRPYGCAQCGKAFKRNEHLARHVVTHSGLKPHACMHCGKAFYRKDHLIKHAQSHTQPPRHHTKLP